MPDLNMNENVNATIPEVQVAIQTTERFIDKTPFNWNLTASEEDENIVIAYNSNTQESFTGTMQEFNARMKR